MKGVQCYELFGGIALKNHAFFHSKHVWHLYFRHVLFQDMFLITYFICALGIVSRHLTDHSFLFRWFYDLNNLLLYFFMFECIFVLTLHEVMYVYMQNTVVYKQA